MKVGEVLVMLNLLPEFFKGNLFSVCTYKGCPRVAVKYISEPIVRARSFHRLPRLEHTFTEIFTFLQGSVEGFGKDQCHIVSDRP